MSEREPGVFGVESILPRTQSRDEINFGLRPVIDVRYGGSSGPRRSRTDEQRREARRDTSIHEAAYKVGDVRLIPTDQHTTPVIQESPITSEEGRQELIKRGTTGETFEEAAGRLSRLANAISRLTKRG